MQLYPIAEVCQWLATHFDCFDRKTFRLSKYLCDKGTPRPEDLLQISRVCELPEDLDDFVVVSNMLLASSQASWVEQCLKAEPTQVKVLFLDFAQLVPDLTQLRHEALVTVHKQEFLQQPLCKWPQLLVKIT
jgi:hypothetical protein